jgi:hypothetical protein
MRRPSAVAAVEVTAVTQALFPLTQFVVEQMDVIGDAVPVEQLVELLVIHAVRALDLAV